MQKGHHAPMRAYAGCYPSLIGLEPVGGYSTYSDAWPVSQARPLVTSPASGRHRRLTGTLVTEADKCE